LSDITFVPPDPSEDRQAGPLAADRLGQVRAGHAGHEMVGDKKVDMEFREALGSD
jgi:hypothetical protein